LDPSPVYTTSPLTEGTNSGCLLQEKPVLPATLQDNDLQSLPHGLNKLGFVFASNNLSSQQNNANMNMGQIIKETLGILNR